MDTDGFKCMGRTRGLTVSIRAKPSTNYGGMRRRKKTHYRRITSEEALLVQTCVDLSVFLATTMRQRV